MSDYFTTKTCCEEGCDAPRHVSRGGQQLTRCQPCQREEWKRMKQAKIVAPHGLQLAPERRCKVCAEVKTLDAFEEVRPGHHRALCADCRRAQERDRHYARRGPVKATAQSAAFSPVSALITFPVGTVLLVDRLRGQAVAVQVLSEIPSGAKRMEHLIAAYQAQGLRIIDAVERVETQS